MSKLAELPSHLEKLGKAWRDPDLFPASAGAAAAYARGMHGRPLHYYVDRIRRLGLRGGKVLDAGTGTGTWSFALSACFDEVIGIDLAEDRVTLARSIADRFGLTTCHYSLGSITALNLPPSSVDAVFCYGVIISAIPLEAALQQFSRVLRPGGALYVCLNGIGWSMYLRDERVLENENYGIMGRDGIYNTICQQQLGSLRACALSYQPVRVSWLERQIARAEGMHASAVVSRWRRLPYRIAAAAARRLGPWVSRRHARVPGLPRELNAASSPGNYLAAWHRLCREHSYGSELPAAQSQIESECGPEYVKLLARDLERIVMGRQECFSHWDAGRGYDPDTVESFAHRAGFECFEWDHEGSLDRTSGRIQAEPIYAGRFGPHLRVWEFFARKAATPR